MKTAAAMSAGPPLAEVAARALALLQATGFAHGQATASRMAKDEVNIAHNEPSLLRSTEATRVALTGIAGGRRATCELAEFDDAALAARITALRDDARAVPADDAHAVSSGQRVRIVQGPQRVDFEALTGAARDLLSFRAREAPKMVIDECFVAWNRVQSHTVTSGGSALDCSVGWYEASVVGTARDGIRVSSFSFAGGTSNGLAGPIDARFGIGLMLRETERQIDASPIGARFTGDVVLAPSAVADLVSWLLGQLDDAQLIAGTSLFQGRVGSQVASPELTLRSRFDAPGVAAVSTDGFATPPVDVLRAGRLVALLPSFYASRKTGLPHVPVAAGGWEVEAGTPALPELIAGVGRGALVGRLSMGKAAANGDFSGVVKNSFLLEDGRIGHALAETMISGNLARMFESVVAASRERLDTGAWLLPWLRIGGLHFS